MDGFLSGSPRAELGGSSAMLSGLEDINQMGAAASTETSLSLSNNIESPL